MRISAERGVADIATHWLRDKWESGFASKANNAAIQVPGEQLRRMDSHECKFAVVGYYSASWPFRECFVRAS